MRVRLLGPIDVMVDGAVRTVSGLRRKAVLATLALHAGEIVSTDRLTDILWGEDAPLTAQNTLQSHVSHLRSVLGTKAAIVAKPPGYVLDTGGEGTDAQLAERLLRQATRSADPAQRTRELREALALWRGRPLADVAGITWLEEQAERLDLLGEQVKRALAEARLAAGEHAQLVPDLERMVAEYPLDERVHGQLMLALYRSGRQADALAAYRRLRSTLGEQLGIDPSQELRDLEAAILRQDASLSLDPPAVAATLLPATPSPAATPLPTVPAQLPPVIAGFAGRDAELASLDAILPEPAADGTEVVRPVIISAIAGTAGVGKTTLALHWAHRVRDRFPDGQLYVNLRGFDPCGPLVEPDLALRGFLEAFEVPLDRIPEGIEAKTGLFRTLLSGKRVLVVLDNARDTEQVRPLLPGSPGSLALVTSRNQLTGLIAAEGAYPLSLDLLTVAEAHDLLAHRIGAHMVASEPRAAEEITASCARLPLALTIAAARAAARPGFPLAAIAAELRESAALLDQFDGGEVAVNVRAVFSCSYHALSVAAARLFRLVGLHPGPDVSVAAAASLAGVPSGQARTLLAELTRAHLLTEYSPGRYSCHDLLCAYAAEQARAHDSPEDREAALRRVLEHFLHTAYACTKVTEPYLAPFTLAPPMPGVTTPDLVTADAADEWLAAEYCTLLTAVTMAADAGLSSTAWQLAWALTSFQLRRGYWQDHACAQQAGLDVARRAGDPAGEAHAMLALALGYARAGRDDDAVPLYAQSLRLLERLDDHLASQAVTHMGLQWVAERGERPADALRHAQRAHELHRAAGNRLFQAGSLNDVGYAHAMLGNYQEAIAYCERALCEIREFSESGRLTWEAATWHSLGYIHQRLGDLRQAVQCYERSLELTRALGDRFNEADTLGTLGDAYHDAGDVAAASQTWTNALRILLEIDHPDAQLIRAKLRGDRDQEQSAA
jgi:DNA-binding SARP family transcriptional activator